MKNRWGSGAAVAAAFLIACGGGEPSVASKSAQAYREAQAKGVNVGGDPSAPSAASTAHDAHAGMDHGASSASSTAVDHAAMKHGTTPDATDHSAHAGSAAVDHAAMGHGSASRATDRSAHGAARSTAASTNHAAMGHGRASARGDHSAHDRAGGAATATNRAAMGHGTAAATTDHSAHRAPARAAASGTDHAAMGHGSTAAASADHWAHAAAPRDTTAVSTPDGSTHSTHAATLQADPHAPHGGAVPATAVIAIPQTNAALEKLKPGVTLQPDAFDAPRPAPVAEAARAREPMDHSGHTRGITAGEDHANPPTPMPATRDGEAFRGTAAPPPAGHDHAGAASNAAPAAAAIYSCPMHPEVTSDKPGTCPKCGMALEKKK